MMKNLFNVYRKLHAQYPNSLVTATIRKQIMIELIDDLYRKEPSPDNPLLNIWYNQPDNAPSILLDIIKDNSEFHDVAVNLGALRLFKLIEQQHSSLKDDKLKDYFNRIHLSDRLSIKIKKNIPLESRRDNTVLTDKVSTDFNLFEGLRKAFKVITDYGPLGWRHEVTLFWLLGNEKSEVTLKNDDVKAIIRDFNDGFQSVSDMLLDETNTTTLIQLNQEAKELLSAITVVNTTANDIFDIKKVSSLSLSWIDIEQKDVLRETILLDRESKYEYLYITNVLNTFINIIGKMSLNKLMSASLEVRQYDAFNEGKLNEDEEIEKDIIYEFNAINAYTGLIPIQKFIHDAKLNQDYFNLLMEA